MNDKMLLLILFSFAKLSSETKLIDEVSDAKNVHNLVGSLQLAQL